MPFSSRRPGRSTGLTSGLSSGLSSLSRLPPWAFVAALFVATRLLAELAMVAGSFWPNKTAEWGGVTPEGLHYLFVPNRWLDVWGRWDSDFYVFLAREGYTRSPPDGGWSYDAAYYPLLPVLIRGLSVLLGGAPLYFCGLFLVNGAFALALWYLWKLVRLDASEGFARLVMAVVLCYPGSHFLSVVYPDSLALFLSVMVAYAARQGRGLLAGLALMLACVSRSSGALAGLVALDELTRAPGGGRRWSWQLGWLALPLVTVVPWLLLNAELHHGDFLYFVHVQAGWGRHASFPFEPLFRFDLTPDYHLLALWALALVGWGAMRARRGQERAGHAVLGLVSVLLPLSTGLLRGVHRYLASNFPLYVLWARFLESRPRWRTGYYVVGVLAMGLYAFQWGKFRHPN